MGGSNKQTQASSSEPWAAAQPALKQGLNDAQALYNKGTAFQPYMGSTVVPYSQQTTQGMNDTVNRANQWQSAFDNNFAKINDNTQYNEGLNTLQRNSVGNFQGLNETLKGLYDQAGTPSYSEQYLKDIASGGMLNRQDPNFERVLNRATENASTYGNMQASAGGRYGSGLGQKAVATAVGDLEANARVGQYNQERANQLAATGMLDQGRNANIANQLNAANARSGVNTSLFNAGQQQQSNIWQGTDALSNAYNAAQQPIQSRMGVGQMNEDLAGRTLNDQLRIWQGQQQAPKNALEWLAAIGSGAGSLGGTQNTTAQGPSSSPFGQALGGLIGLNSLL